MRMATIERVKTKLGKKTIIKTPIRYAYFLPEYVKQKDRYGNDRFRWLAEDASKPLVIDLKTGVAVEDATLLDLEERIGQPCSTAANSRENPAKFEYQKKLRYTNCIEYISILEYKDTGNAVFTFLKRKNCWLRSSGKTFHKDDVKYKLTIRKGGKTTLTENGVMCLTNTSILEVLRQIIPLMRIKYIARYRGYVILRKMFIKYFFGVDKMSAKEFDAISYPELISLYRVKQNAKLHDLPWSEAELASIYGQKVSLYMSNNAVIGEGERRVGNVKVSLNRYLRRGDTKKAIEACFFGFSYPKSIRRVLMKTKPLEFKYSAYKAIADLVEAYGTDTARNFISEQDGTPKHDMIANPYYMRMIRIGFSLAQISQHNQGYMKDVVQMHNRLLGEEYALVFRPNIREYHNYLMGMTIELDREEREQRVHRNEEHRRAATEQRRRLNDAYINTDTSKQISRFEAPDFVFRSPDNPIELDKVGSDLNICVGMYKEDFFLGRLDIILITEIKEDGTEKYIACLEAKRNKLVQAKLNSNRPVKTNPKLLKILKSWAKSAGIGLASSDVGVTNARYVEDNPDNPERVAIAKGELIDVNE